MPTEQENEAVIRQWLGLSGPSPDLKTVLEALRGVHENTMALLWVAAVKHWNQRLAEIPQFLESGSGFRPAIDEREMTQLAYRTGSAGFVALTPDLIETTVRIVARAIEVLGDKDKALRWLQAPVRVLGNQTPVSLLSTAEGLARVEDTLGRIEHGIW